MDFTPRSIRLCAAFAASILLFAGSQSFAGPILVGQVTISIKIDDSPTAASWSYSPSANDYRRATDADGGYELSSPLEFDILSNRAHVRIEELQYDPDPFVLNNILVTNTTSSTQIFSAFVGLPTVFPSPNFISGNVTTNVIDGGDDGATIATTSPTSLYQAQIDGTTVATLLDHLFILTAAAGGSNTASALFGPNPSAVPVTSNIGIQLRFALTAGDTASIFSRFDVTRIPEPASAAVIGIGLALVAGGIRRRQ